MENNNFRIWLQNLQVAPVDWSSAAAARRIMDGLCKPDGGLGLLEEALLRLAAIQGTPYPAVREQAVVVFAADHGVVEEGVSSFTCEDSTKMVQGILQGKTAVGVLALAGQITLSCWDVGLAGDVSSENYRFPLHRVKVARGTANFTRGPAMTLEQCQAALRRGCAAVEGLPRNVRLIALGEMGMGNTTAAAALTAALLQLPPAQVVGTGAGSSNLEHKQKVVAQALTANAALAASDTLGILAALGGLELAALTGACLQAAALGKGIVLDGFVTSAAALAACRLKPEVTGYLLASHLSPEPGHNLILKHLGLVPPMNLNLRVGEGAGALLFFPLLEQALTLQQGMARFADLGIHLQK